MTKKYEIQTIKDKEAPHGVHYRVTEIATDSRIATCYLKENAQLVCDALNEYDTKAAAFIRKLKASRTSAD